MLELFYRENGTVKSIRAIVDPRKPAGSLAARYSDATYGIYIRSPWDRPKTLDGFQTYTSASEAQNAA